MCFTGIDAHRSVQPGGATKLARINSPKICVLFVRFVFYFVLENV